MSPDFSYSMAGLHLVLLQPLTAAAVEWVDENIVEVQPRFGGAIPIEPRFFDSVAEGITRDGLTFQTN